MRYAFPVLIGVILAWVGLRLLLPAARCSDFYLERRWRTWVYPWGDDRFLLAGLLDSIVAVAGLGGLRLLIALLGLFFLLLAATLFVLAIVAACGGL